MDSAPKPSDTEEKKDAPAPAAEETPSAETKPVDVAEKTAESSEAETAAPSDEKTSDQTPSAPVDASSGPAMQEGHAVVGPAESSEGSSAEATAAPQPADSSPSSTTEAPSVTPASSAASEGTPSFAESSPSAPSGETPAAPADQTASTAPASTDTAASPSQPGQPAAPQSTFMDSMPPARSSGGMMKWIIGIVIVLVLAGGAFFLFGRHKAPAPQQSTVAPTEAPTPTPNPTALWKTYTNDTAGYSVKYPPTWTVATTDKTIDLQITSPQKEVIKLERQANPQKLGVAAWMKQTYPKADLSTYKEATISGQDTMKNDTKGAAYILLPDKEILTVLYLECAQATCGAGKAEPETFDQVVASLQTTSLSGTTTPAASPSSQTKK